jgi:hypothetical protein
MTPKPFNQLLQKRLGALGDRRMTYIAAFPCRQGYVCCADTLETVGDEKQYIEKLNVYGDGEYPLCIGGAGSGEIIDALSQEIGERVVEQMPQGAKALEKCIRSAVREVYETDVPVMAIKKLHRTAELLIASNANLSDSEFCLFHVKGRRVFKVKQGIIGYSTATNQALLKRFHDPKMAMSQAVILAVYLVSQSKLTDEGVGGGTSIGIVSQFSATIEDTEYIRFIEKIIAGYLPVADDLFLNLSDMEISNDEFERRLYILNQMLRVQRKAAVSNSLEYVQYLVDEGLLNKSNSSYSKVPLGTTFQLTKNTDGRMVVSSVTENSGSGSSEDEVKLSELQTSEDQQ